MGINTLTNIATRIWSMISIYIFVPLYISILGETSYGLVSFFATLQTAFNILGLGLANTLRREFAVGDSNKENAIIKYKLLRSVETIYLVISIFIFLICLLFSNQIATNWLNIETLDFLLVSRVISLMGLSIAIQFVSNLYSGCLFGLNKQMLANISCIVWSASKYIGSLLLIWIIKPDLILFYSWHIICDIFYLLLMRYETINNLKLICDERIWRIRDISCLKDIWKYTLGILLISFIALINKQLDKVVISNNLTLTELGSYNVATTLGSLTAIIPTALYVSVFPIFTKYVTTGNSIKLKEIFSSLNKVTNISLSCIIAYVAVFSDILIKVWTGSENYVHILGYTSVFVVMAVGLVEYQELPYALTLANGNTKYNVIVGGVFIPITFLTTIIGIQKYGLLGAGAVYMLLMFFQTIILTYLIYKKYVYKKAVLHVLQEIIFPLVLSFVAAILFRLVVNQLNINDLITLFIAICGGLFSLISELLLLGKNELILTINILLKGD